MSIHQVPGRAMIKLLSSRTAAGVVATAACFHGAQASAAPNLVSNGTFDVDLSGWSLVGANNSLTGFNAVLGSPFPGAFRNGNTNSVAATLSQDINTAIGSHFELSFAFRDSTGSIGNDAFKVLFGDQLVVDGVLAPNSGTWATYTFSALVATNSTTRLSFSGFDNAVAWRVDSVSVHETSIVPGPLPLLGVAAAFGYSRKLRARIKAAQEPPHG